MGVATIYNQTQDAVLPGSTNSTISCLLAVMQASLKTTLVTTSALFSAWLGASQPIADNSAAARCVSLLSKKGVYSIRRPAYSRGDARGLTQD